MAWADVNAKLSFTGMTAGDRKIVRDLMKNAYQNSATAKKMFDDFIAMPGKTINVKQVDGAFQAVGAGASGRIEIDLAWLAKNSYTDNNGTAQPDTATTAVLHELVHALANKDDNWTMVDYRGDTVKLSNKIYKELGLPEQNSYIAYDVDGSLLKRGFEYTNGTAIDRSFAGDSNWNSSRGGDKSDLLIGGPGANLLEAGLGDDFLFGGGGNDTLNGGLGGNDTVVLSGKPTDYDIRLKDNGTWTAKHVRGDKDEGNDIFKNLEKVTFKNGLKKGGETYNLTKGGLTFQTDIAFVVDQTGSMFDDIAAVKETASRIVNNLFNKGTIDARIGIVGFRDNTIGETTQIVLPFTDQVKFADRKNAAIAAINTLFASGGGDTPESAFDGLLKALNGDMGEWRKGAGVKQIILFTDAPAKDTELAGTVATFAADIGATISGRSSKKLGKYGEVDTFRLETDDTAGRDSTSHGEDLPKAKPSGDPTEEPGSEATVQIITIFVETFIEPDPELKKVSKGSGGKTVSAADAEAVVDQVLKIVNTPNYNLTSSVDEVVEGNKGKTTVTFNLSRDRADKKATVELKVVGNTENNDTSSIPKKITFKKGETSISFTVDIKGDRNLEESETFGIRIKDVNKRADFSDDAAKVVIINDETINGNPKDNKIVGSQYDDKINGKGGDDTIIGKSSDDTLSGDNGSDTLRGENGSDNLKGGGNDDRLEGGKDKDRLDGGSGNDTLQGGQKADVFIFDKNHGKDTILDYRDGLDKINLAALKVKFGKLKIKDQGKDTLINTGEGTILLVDTDHTDIDKSDFIL